MKEKIDILIEELIQLSQLKYDKLKDEADTLQIDIVFIQKFEDLKSLLDIESFEGIDVNQYPSVLLLRENISEISAFEESRNNRQVRVSKAVNAYKKNKNGA